MIVELKNIDKNYGAGQIEVPALKNVSLQVDDGEYIAIRTVNNFVDDKSCI